MYSSTQSPRLEHYNKWLLDPNRPVGERYPGYPGDLIVARGRAILQQEVEVKVARKKEQRAARAPKPVEPGSKLAIAIDLYRQHGGDKQSTINAIQTQCNMTVAGATTYFYNARKHQA
jgi:hypothetical protein